MKRRRALPLALLLGAVAAAAFLPSLRDGFLDWDDDILLLDNLHYRGLGPAALRWMLTTLHVGHYMPVTWLTYGLDFRLWGMEPGGYHLTNLVLHAAAVAVFTLVAFHLLRRASPAPGNGALLVGAAVAALAFGLHPLRVESVTWVTERRDVLSALFYLLAVWAYLERAEVDPGRPTGARTRRRWYVSTLACFLLALLSKSMAVTLPLVLLVIDVYPLRRVPPRPAAWLGPGARAVVWEKLPMLGLGLAAGLVAVAGVATLGNTPVFAHFGVGPRIAVSLHGLVFYLWKTAVPVGLSPLYELSIPVDPLAPLFLLAGAVVVAVTAAAVVLRRRWPALAAVWTAYVVILLPVLGLGQNGPQIAADRYTYLACLGWALCAGAAASRGWQAWTSGRLGRMPAMLGAALVLAGLATLGALTWRQTTVWHDAESLWTHGLAVTPSPFVKNRVGVVRMRQGRLREARELLEEAVRASPGLIDARYNLGLVLLYERRPAEAMEHFREAVRRRPRYAEAENAWGFALLTQDRPREALPHLEAALRLDPGYAEAHTNAGVALAQQERWVEAIAHFTEAVRLRPDRARPHHYLGLALVRQGRPGEAIAEFRAALAIDPGLAEARAGLDAALAAPR